MENVACLVCESPTLFAGSRKGARTGREFSLRRCAGCGFAFVEKPWTDYAHIYDDDYYAGRGSDPLIDYASEVDDASTVRVYEWRGWDQLVQQLKPAPIKWLDFGCGCGTLVRHISALKKNEIYGFDQGAWAEKARAAGYPILTESELARHEGTFDVVTAIDVIEHAVDPIEMLQRWRRLMKPGGLLIPMTGNAEIAPRENFAGWSYVRPEIHVSYFTPDSLSRALRRTGFAPRALPLNTGWGEILRARILKNLRVKRRNLLERMVPWRVLSPMAESIYKMGRLPMGEAI